MIKMAEELTNETGIQFYAADNKYARMGGRDSFVFASSALKILATSYTKIANDIRWMNSGPRAGLQEIRIPRNDPGSSIMPGKLNPVQAEAVAMIAAQVIGNDTTISFAGTQGNFELNIMNPVIIVNLLQSANLLADISITFAKNLIDGIKIRTDYVKQRLENSLMLSTAISPKLGYQKTAALAINAYNNDLTLKEVCMKEKCMTEKEFDFYTNPQNMIKATHNVYEKNK